MTLNAKTLPSGEEQWEVYYSAILKGERCNYDYRTPDGELFTCIDLTLERCRAWRDRWLLERAKARWPKDGCACPQCREGRGIIARMAEQPEGAVS